MPKKCCWVIHGSLTCERKACTSPSSFINHSTLLLNRALKRQAPCLYMHCEVRALDRLRLSDSESERGDALGLRAVEVIICMITRDFSVISMTSQASLSLSLPLTKVPDAQYRKRFRASYNTFTFTRVWGQDHRIPALGAQRRWPRWRAVLPKYEALVLSFPHSNQQSWEQREQISAASFTQHEPV